MVGEGPIWVAVGDFNSDGRPDLVSANSKDATLSVYLGDSATGGSSFRAATPLGEQVLRNTPQAVDLNNDGTPAFAGAASVPGVDQRRDPGAERP